LQFQAAILGEPLSYPVYFPTKPFSSSISLIGQHLPDQVQVSVLYLHPQYFLQKALLIHPLHENKQNIEYAASKKDCAVCAARSDCTRSRGPRSMQRHVRQEYLVAAIQNIQVLIRYAKQPTKGVLTD
jgi:hypothetical protein